MRVAVIGGAGFCGHSLAIALAADGHDVGVFDNFSLNHYGQWVAAESHYRARYQAFLDQRMDLLRVAGVHISNVSAADYHLLSQALAKFAPDTVIHLAAMSHGGRSNQEEHAAYESQLTTLKNVRDYCVGADAHLIYQSSSMVYGHFEEPVEESARLDPIGHYGNYKLCCERMVLSSHQVSGLTYTIVRPSALYGPRCVSRRVVQCFVEAAFDGGPVRIEGDGESRLDFTWVGDWVRGMLLLVNHPAARNETFNLTYGQSVSLNDLADAVRQDFPSLPVVRVAPDKAYPRRGALSIDKARDLLEYAPETSVAVGVPRYIAWYRDVLQGAV